MRLVLASSSPRRQECLRNAGFTFEVLAAHVDETVCPGESPEEHVRRLALAKAQRAASFLPTDPPAVVIGADTMVAIQDEMLGKPDSREDARRMLRLLSGKTHQVLTGLALVLTGSPEAGLAGGRSKVEHETTLVHFLPLSDEEIEDYLATGEYMDKAGAYAVQGYASRFVRAIEGDYFNVVGLPISRLYRMLRGWGLMPVKDLSRMTGGKKAPTGGER